MTAQPTPESRVRPLLLILLLVWAAVVFLVVDLCVNVPEFDRLRPNSELYRATRSAAHELVDDPYLERDEFALGSPPAAPRSDPAALKVVQAEVQSHAREPTQVPTIEVPESTMQRVDLRDVAPPPQFRGSELEWRLQGHMSDGEMASLLRNVVKHAPRDRWAILARIGRDPNPRLAEAFIEARSDALGVPSLLYYIAAGDPMMRVVRESAGEGSGVRGGAPAAADGAVVSAVLKAVARLVTRYRPHLSIGQWAGVRRGLERIQVAYPGYESLPPYREDVDAIRAAVVQTLVAAAIAEPNHIGGLEPVRVAVLIGDERVHDAMLDLLRARDIFNQKIVAAEPRADIAFVGLVADAIRQSETARQRNELGAFFTEELLRGQGSAKQREAMTRQALAYASAMKQLDANWSDPALAAALELVSSAEENR